MPPATVKKPRRSMCDEATSRVEPAITGASFFITSPQRNSQLPTSACALIPPGRRARHLFQSQCYASVVHGASASSDKATRSCSYISAQNCAAPVETGLPHFVRAWKNQTQSRNTYSLRLLFPYRKDENHRAAATRMSAPGRSGLVQ